jgi:hypothetical protein
VNDGHLWDKLGEEETLCGDDQRQKAVERVAMLTIVLELLPGFGRGRWRQAGGERRLGAGGLAALPERHVLERTRGRQLRRAGASAVAGLLGIQRLVVRGEDVAEEVVEHVALVVRARAVRRRGAVRRRLAQAGLAQAGGLGAPYRAVVLGRGRREERRAARVRLAAGRRRVKQVLAQVVRGAPAARARGRRAVGRGLVDAGGPAGRDRVDAVAVAGAAPRARLLEVAFRLGLCARAARLAARRALRAAWAGRGERLGLDRARRSLPSAAGLAVPREQIAASKLRAASLSPRSAPCPTRMSPGGYSPRRRAGPPLYLRRAHERDGETRQAGHIRVFRWRFRCVERVYLASQSGHCFVWGREGMLPPWRRILEEMLADLAREAGGEGRADVFVYRRDAT